MYNVRYDANDCDETVYYKILSDLNRIESDRNDIVNLLNDGYKHDITLLGDKSKIFMKVYGDGVLKIALFIVKL